MNFKSFLLTLILLVTTLFLSCKKFDTTLVIKEKITDISIAEKFFDTHKKYDSLENKLVEYIKSINKKSNVINQLVKNVGYPRWNKAFDISKKK